jgi:pimeloyl-ACP methyl ester carboxylesterase
MSTAGVHRMAYWEWGDPSLSRVLLCLHGLTRTGRDFDVLAQRLSSCYRVVCPDLVGRGQSDWLTNSAFYTVPQYMADLVTLIARLAPKTLHWVGTSLGGLVGMGVGGACAQAATGRHAGQALIANQPIAPKQQGGLSTGRFDRLLPPEGGLRLDKLVLNDVGPHLPWAALERISHYTAEPAQFASLAEAAAYVRTTAASFGMHSDAEWDDLTRHVYRREGQHWVKHYDLGIAVPFAQHSPAVMAAGEQQLWQAFEALTCPVLVLRGAQSDLLTAATVQDMLRRQPRARVLELPGVGHAPTLMHHNQIEPVVRFLLDETVSG